MFVLCTFCRIYERFTNPVTVFEMFQSIAMANTAREISENTILTLKTELAASVGREAALTAEHVYGHSFKNIT